MTYKVLDFDEKSLVDFKGRIVAVLKSELKSKRIRSNIVGCSLDKFEYEWHLTCLVEVE